MSPRHSFGRSSQRTRIQTGGAAGEVADRRVVTADAELDKIVERERGGEDSMKSEGKEAGGRSMRESGNSAEGELHNGRNQGITSWSSSIVRQQKPARTSGTTGASSSDWFQEHTGMMASGYIGRVAYLWPNDVAAVKQAVYIARKLKK